jgi:23S rRNA pseudouridine2605 synthase
MPERLQKILAAAGIASRRKAEEIIAAGRVTLNGTVVTEQGTKADPEVDAISVDGKPIKRPQRFVYFLLNKPKGYVTTVSDPEGRPTVMELLGDLPERVYPVGRLDYASEGLLLMTNDGPQKSVSPKTLQLPGTRSFSSKAATAKSAACFTTSASS